MFIGRGSCKNSIDAKAEREKVMEAGKHGIDNWMYIVLHKRVKRQNVRSLTVLG